MIDRVRSAAVPRKKFRNETFFQEKGHYLQNGIGLTEALLLSEDELDGRLRACILSGMHLSEGMMSLGVFSSREISLVRLAEETGDLAGTFHSIHITLKEQRELSSKIRTVLIYPLLLLATAYVFLVCAVYYIVPPLYEMLRELEAENTVLRSLSYIHLHIPLPAILLFTAALLLYLIRTARNSDSLHRWVLGAKTSRYKEMIFMEELSLLTRGGMDLLESLEILKEAGYPCDTLLSSIESGSGLKGAFQKDGFSSVLVGYLSMAEETGNYTDAFTSFVHLEKLYFREYLKKKTALIEPAAIITMGLLVFAVAYIIMIPMLDAYEGF